MIVEGKDDKEVIRHLKLKCIPSVDFEIKQTEGINKLLDAIGPQLKAEGRLALGILVDANSDPQARFQAICHRITKAGKEKPDSYSQIVHGPPRIGVWMMPNNQSPGELEDFISDLIPSDDLVWPLAQEYITGIPAEIRRFRDGKILRAQVHSWLAARKEPRQMGLAIGAGDLDINHQSARDLVGWLSDLFHPD